VLEDSDSIDQVALTQAKSCELYGRREIALAAGDSIRITKNFRFGTDRFTNNELCRVTAIRIMMVVAAISSQDGWRRPCCVCSIPSSESQNVSRSSRRHRGIHS
jgi:hypothetical protein